MAGELIAKLHGAKVLSGLGRAGAFTRNVKTALATEQRVQGGPLLMQDCGFQEFFLNNCLRRDEGQQIVIRYF